ncbi:MAG: CoA transferase [Gammaproteobacteria bacterium]|nr:CoA transferase [Gammaproteobacteria bacterium]
MKSNPIRVLEIGDDVASTYAAKLMGDHGADVIKVEPPGGSLLRSRGPFPAGTPDAEHSGLSLALDVNKRGVTVDPSDTSSWRRLLEWADVLIHDLDASTARARGLDAHTLRETFSALVTLAITPFGHSGPYQNYQAEELTLANAGGWANLCPATHTDPSLPPLKACGDQCGLMAAVAGAMTALAMVREARRSGTGEFIDLSIHAYVASVLEIGIPAYSYMGNVIARHHQRSLIPWRIFQAKDRPIFIVCVEQDQWQRLVEFMGTPDWATLEVFTDQPSRAENQDLVHEFVQEFVSEWTAADLYHAAQKHRICMAPVLNLGEIASNEHLHARRFFTEVTRGEDAPIQHMASAVLTTHGRAAVSRPAPALGEHNQDLDDLPARERTTPSSPPALPLAGVRVLDLTWAWAGPFATMNLAHLGAQVIRIESEKRADLYRRFPVCPEGDEPTLNSSGMFNQWNQGKSSITVDLSTDEGTQLVRDLVVESDVVVQNFATGVIERLGLGYEALRAINPGIILASISGYGQAGPYREYMGYGPAIGPLTGLATGTGYLNGEPEELGLSMPDPNAGITAAMAVVSALLKRDETGEGDHLDVSLWEATGVLNVSAWMDYAMNGAEAERIGNRHPDMAPHGCFECAGEDRWVSIACRSDGEWLALANLMGSNLGDHERFATVAGRKTNEDELETRVSEWTSGRDRWELARALQALGIAAFPTMTTEDIVNDPHLVARGLIENLAHPEVGARAHTGIPWLLDRRPNGVRHPAPCLDADTDRLLNEILEYSDKQLMDLRARRIIGV